jgi:hypothetical protein
MGTDGGDGCSTLWLSVGGEILSKCVCVCVCGVSLCVYMHVCVSLCVCILLGWNPGPHIC